MAIPGYQQGMGSIPGVTAQAAQAPQPQGYQFDGAKNWLFGGNATKGMANGPASADQQRAWLTAFSNGYAPTQNTAQSDQTRGQQGQLAGMLFQQAQGLAPTAGELAVNRQVGQGAAQQTAQASMARGANAALAARTAARMNQAGAVDGAGMAAQAALAGQANAQGQLGGLLGNMRQQDIGVAGANQGAQLETQSQQLQAMAQMLGVDVATLQQDLAKRQIAAGDKGMFPTLLQVGGQVLAAKAGAK